MSDTTYLAALCAVPELGPITVRRLIKAFGSARGVFGADQEALRRVEMVGETRAANIKAFRGFEALSREIERVRAEGVGVLTGESASYPDTLRQMGDDAPVLLYVRGELLPEDELSIAIVGTRKATPYGRGVAERFAMELAALGMTIVSGGAWGIDTASHIGAMRAHGGRTIAVLGSGIDVPYPSNNRGLFERIAGTGAVVSEFPPGTPPSRENFPIRNRLVSGLSLGVLVVESALRSGALITARMALEQGREVFAVPGNINSEYSKGPNDLIRQGARIAIGPEDIIQELAPRLMARLEQEAREGAKVKALASLTPSERSLCDIMGAEPLHIDEISRRSGLSVAEALGALLALELGGIVKQTEGKRFHLP